MGNYVLAHDLGTTGNKATLYDREGCLAGSAFFAYDTGNTSGFIIQSYSFGQAFC